MHLKTRQKLSFIFTKIANYEYWSYAIFYFPMYFYGLYLALKSRSFMYFSTANPGMKYGGVMGESKYKILSSIPSSYLPKSIFILRSTSFSKILTLIKKAEFFYPFIIKPDIGERGKDVELIRNEGELKLYLDQKIVDLIIQEYIEYDLEFGIMYHRFPDQDQGQVTSIVKKGILSVTGDGKRNLQELIASEIRAAGRMDYFQLKFKDELKSILAVGETIRLEPIENHNRGTTFFNANHLINEKLNIVFNKIAVQIQGYYYGRFDLKVPSLDNLYAGKNIIILELNGVSSELGHIYDPEYKLLRAYKDIAFHMNIIAKIAKLNHISGHRYQPLGSFLYDLRKHLKKS